MEFLYSSTTTILALALSIYFLLLIAKNGKRKAEKSKSSAPEAAGAWPIIGHLHLLGGSGLLHKTLGAMADKFGPIFTIKLGLHRALVVSNSEIAKECLYTNDVVFATRSKFIAVEVMGYNYAMFGFGPYGPYWRQVRKIVVLELLSNRRLELLGHLRRSEVKTSINEIYEVWAKNKRESGSDKVLMEMKKWFEDLTLNIIGRIVTGKRYSGKEEEEVVRFQKAIREFFELVGLILVADALPFLRWLDLGGYEKAMKRTGKDLDSILQKWLDEHKQKRISSGEVKIEQDFMDVMLSILEGDAATEDEPRYDADTIIKSTCLTAFAAGSDTTTVTLTWALSLLLNNPHTLEKAQKELDIHVGRERQVEESDLKNLVYLHAIIKETLRLYPAGPVLSRESMEDCTVGGYHIPKGTRLLINASKIQRDPSIWPNPDEFRPERFLTTHKDIDIRGQNFELIPFGSGRRICPGISFSLQVLQLTLANLLHEFELATVSDEPIDMSEGMGLTNLKTTPLEVFLTPRLSTSLVLIKERLGQLQ